MLRLAPCQSMNVLVIIKYVHALYATFILAVFYSYGVSVVASSLLNKSEKPSK